VNARRVLSAAVRIAAGVLFASSLGACAASTLPPVHSENERLEVARSMAAKKDYYDAIELLKTYTTNNAGSAEVDHAVYLLGDCYLLSREWASAAVEFERLLREFPESDSSAAAAFALGAAYDGQSKPPDFDQEFTVKAVEQWHQYLANYPGHWQNAEANHRIQLSRMRLADKLVATGDLYFKLRDYGPSRVYYQLVEARYNDLPQLGDAWIGLARLDAYEGRKKDAIERLKQTEEQFAGRPVAATAARERHRLEN
jgi:outer membrane protein assembly factor BamD